MRLAKPRIAPLTEAEWTDAQRKLLQPVHETGKTYNVLGTMAQHWDAAQKFLVWAYHGRYGAALAGVKAAGTLRRRCRHRPVQDWNNILEPDHRAIKRRVKAKQGFRAFHPARPTLAGYEAIHMLRKGQPRWLRAKDARQQNRSINQLFDLAA